MKSLHEESAQEVIDQETANTRTSLDEQKIPVHEIGFKKLKSLSMETVLFTRQSPTGLA